MWEEAQILSCPSCLRHLVLKAPWPHTNHVPRPSRGRVEFTKALVTNFLSCGRFTMPEPGGVSVYPINLWLLIMILHIQQVTSHYLTFRHLHLTWEKRLKLAPPLGKLGYGLMMKRTTLIQEVKAKILSKLSHKMMIWILGKFWLEFFELLSDFTTSNERKLSRVLSLSTDSAPSNLKREGRKSCWHYTYVWHHGANLMMRRRCLSQPAPDLFFRDRSQMLQKSTWGRWGWGAQLPGAWEDRRSPGFKLRQLENWFTFSFNCLALVPSPLVMAQ